MKELLLKARALQAQKENKYKTVFVHVDGPCFVQNAQTFPSRPTSGWYKLGRNYNNPEGSLIKVK